MNGNYWARVTERRVGRRRALTFAGGTALSAAFLAACGDDDDTGGTQTSTGGSTGAGGTATGGGTTGGGGSTGAQSSDPSGLLTQAVDTTAQARQGGTLKHWADGDAVHFDALASNANGVINWISAFAYPRMLRFATPKIPEIPDGSLEGELASSFELSPDRLQITFKVRQGMLWDEREPTNGRAIDAEDVMFSWNKFSELNQSAGNMANARSSSAPIQSMEATDNETIVVKLVRPDASLLPLFASWDHFYQMPRESDGGFDPRQVIRGHGPWQLEEHVPSTRFVWQRNPNYFLEGLPYPDKLERPIIPEYSSRLAQFRSGNIHTHVANPNDILQTKKDVPETAIYQADTFLVTISNFLSFGYEDDSPFKDARVRQAASMLVDRDGYVDVMDSRDIFTAEGIDIPTAYNTVVAAGFNDYWLDPTDEAKFGESAKYLQYNVEEAKKLMAAAGHPDGFDYDMYFSNSLYGAPYLASVELMASMLHAGGMRASQIGLPYEQFKDIYYEAYFGPSYASGKTKGFNGIVHLANPGLPTVPSHLFTFVHKDGGRFHGLTPTGTDAHLGDPRLNEDIEKIKAEFDRDAQISMVHDLTRYFTEQSYYIPRAAHVRGLTLVWPGLANYQTYVRAPADNQWAESNLYWWMDETKAPFN